MQNNLKISDENNIFIKSFKIPTHFLHLCRILSRPTPFPPSLCLLSHLSGIPSRHCSPSIPEFFLSATTCHPSYFTGYLSIPSQFHYPTCSEKCNESILKVYLQMNSSEHDVKTKFLHFFLQLGCNFQLESLSSQDIFSAIEQLIGCLDILLLPVCSHRISYWLLSSPAPCRISSDYS